LLSFILSRASSPSTPSMVTEMRKNIAAKRRAH